MTARQYWCAGRGRKTPRPAAGALQLWHVWLLLGIIGNGQIKLQLEEARGCGHVCPPLPPIVAFAPATTPQKKKSHHTLTLWSSG